MSKEDHKEILEVYKKAAKQAMEKDRKFLEKQLKEGKISKETYESLILKEVIAGTGYNDLEGLTDLKRAQEVVPKEAHYNYRSMRGSRIHPWIDSAGGKAPEGSDGIPVILAKDNEEKAETFKDRIKTTKLEEVPKWYGIVPNQQMYTAEEITEDEANILKKIEKNTYREEQQLMNQNEIKEGTEIEDIYGIKNAKIIIGSNNSWYLIYGEEEETITISDLAMQGALNAENSGQEGTNIMLATAEATKTLYELLIKAGKEKKEVTCNATKDTSLINIKRMLEKGLIKVKDEDGNEIIVSKDKKLVNARTGKEVEYRKYSEDGQIEMLDLKIEPDVEKLNKEIPKVEDFLEKARQKERMKGKEKNKEIDNLRREIRNDLDNK